jgi:sugar porter (SP) family MFS transporter
MNSKLFRYTFVAALGGMLFGFDTAVISGTIPFITKYFQLSEVLVGWTVSSALIGCIFGSIFVGKPADKWGRKKMLFVTALLFLFSALGTGFAPSFSFFIVARFIGGIAIGGASVLSPMYITEIAPSEKRGRLVATAQLAIVLGILLAFFSNYVLIGTGENNWRYMLLAGSIPATLFFALLFTVGDSPRWLIKINKIDRAKKIIADVNPKGDTDKTINEIIKTINNETTPNLSVMFRKPYLKLVLIGIAVGMFNQFTGINVIMYYAPTILKYAGFSDDSALMQTVLVGVTNLVFTVLAMSVIDKIGRKMLLLIGAVGMFVFSGLFSITFFMHAFGGYMLLIFMVGFIAFFASSQGVVIWVLLSEMFPNNVRARGSSIGTFSHWCFNAAIAFLFPVAAKAFGVGPIFAFYSIATLVSFFFFKKYLVETKGKSLEELEQYMLSDKSK